MQPIPTSNPNVLVKSTDGKFATPTALANLVSADAEQIFQVGSDGKFFVKAPVQKAGGALLAALACVGSPVLVPTGRPDDVKTVGTGGDFPDLSTAIASPAVVAGTILRLISNLAITATVDVTKSVVIDLAGFTVSSASTNPVTMVNMTAPLSVVRNGTVSHLKTTNTSVETVFNLNSSDASKPVFVVDTTINAQEFGVTARGNFVIADNSFNYVGASLTNSHRYIGVYGSTGTSRITGNTFTAITAATTRYTNFILMTSGATFGGKLYIDNNTQTGGSLRQFFVHEAGTVNGMELYVANNTFDDLNGGIGILTPTLYNSYSKIGIYGNTQGASAAGNFKGVFFVDGSGAISDTVELAYAGNTTAAGALRADYVSYASDSTNIIAIKNTVTYTALKTQPELNEAQLDAIGSLLQELKGKRTYVVDSEGNPIQGNGTEADPFVVPGGGMQPLETTSLTPVVYDTAWVGAQADTESNLAKAIELSNGTLLSSGLVTWTGHGLDVGETYYTSQTTTGDYVTPAPTSGLMQALFTVIDANTIAVQVQEGADAVDGFENENTISYQTSSNTKPNGPLKNDLLFVTSDGTRDGKMTEEWIYDGVAWVLIEGTTPVSGSVIDNTITDSAAVDTSGRYIVPATGLSNDFVGHANQYADWDGSTWTFTNATTNDAVLINSGPNAGQVWKFNGTTWSAATQTTGLAAYNWNLTSAYKATDLVIYNNNWYQANGNIPANTAFAIGTTGATWKQIGGATQSDYISVMRATSDQTAVGASTDLLFNSVTKTTGGILFNGAGVFTLKAGVTYKLEANVAFTNFSDATNGYTVFAWADATTGTLLTGVSRGVANAVNRNAGETSQTFAGGLYTPSTNQSIKLRTDTASGTAAFRVNLSSASIVQIAPSAIVPSTVSVNDQITSEFFDIGTMRIQTGRDTQSIAGTRTITLPAPFANTNYRITYGADSNADGLVRSVNTTSKTTTNFTAINRHQNGGSSSDFEWVAIGKKP